MSRQPVHHFASLHQDPDGRPYRLRLGLGLEDAQVVGTHPYRLTEQGAAAWHEHVTATVAAGGMVRLIDHDGDWIAVPASQVTLVLVKAMDEDQDEAEEETFPLAGRAAFLGGLNQTRKR